MNTTLHLTLRIGNRPETLLHLIDEPAEVARYAEKIRAALEPLTKWNPSKPRAGRPGRMVVVMDVDYDAHDEWVEKGGGNSIRALEAGEKQFASAAEASRFLGCRTNEVGNGLAAAKRKGNDEAKVRGVTFKFADDLGSSK